MKIKYKKNYCLKFLFLINNKEERKNKMWK